MNLENKKTKIIAASVVWVLILWIAWFFWYQKFMNKPVKEPDQVEKTVDEENKEVKENNKEEETVTDEFEETRKEIIDWLTMNYVESLNTMMKKVEWLDVVNEQIKISNTKKRSLWMNSMLQLSINTHHNLNDVESLVEWEDKEETSNLEEDTESDVEETENWNDEWTEKKTEEKEKVKEIKTPEEVWKWKKEWTYNWIKWDFDWELKWKIKIINKNSDKTKNETLTSNFEFKFSWNDEKESIKTTRFWFKTNIWEIEELSRLDDYLVQNKFLNLEAWKTWLVMKKLSFVKLTSSINELIEWMKENKIFNISKEKIEDTKIESENTEETTNNEEKDTNTNTDTDTETKTEWVEKVEEKQLQSSWKSEKWDELDKILDWEDKKDVNEVKEDTESETSDWKETTWEDDIQQEDTNVEKEHYYVSLNNEWLKTLLQDKYDDLKKVFELFWESINNISEEDFNNATLDWEIKKEWSNIELYINSFKLWNLDIKWIISDKNINLNVNWKVVVISLTWNWMKIKITNENEKYENTININQIDWKNWLTINSKLISWSWKEKFMNMLKIQVLLEKWNEKLPALYEPSEDTNPQIKLNKIITEYSEILQKNSKEFINEWWTKTNTKEVNKKETNTKEVNKEISKKEKTPIKPENKKKNTNK